MAYPPREQVAPPLPVSGPDLPEGIPPAGAAAPGYANIVHMALEPTDGIGELLVQHYVYYVNGKTVFLEAYNGNHVNVPRVQVICLSWDLAPSAQVHRGSSTLIDLLNRGRSETSVVLLTRVNWVCQIS